MPPYSEDEKGFYRINNRGFKSRPIDFVDGKMVYLNSQIVHKRADQVELKKMLRLQDQEETIHFRPFWNTELPWEK